MIFQPAALLIAIPPFATALFLAWNLNRKRGLNKWPFKESLLRPPGESLRLKIQAFDDKINEQMLFLAIPLILAVFVSSFSQSLEAPLLFFVLSVIYAFIIGSKLQKTLKKRRHYHLGFEGERIVGQEITQVLSSGYKVYHDLQFDGFNIDHVIIGPSGVFTIETKSRRKGLNKDSHKLTYDGQKLYCPEWEDFKGLEQAQRNAKTLSRWLSQSTGQTIWVTPILTFPGWLINRAKPGSIHVLNPKEIIGFVTQSSKTILSPSAIQQISYQVGQKSLITD